MSSQGPAPGRHCNAVGGRSGVAGADTRRQAYVRGLQQAGWVCLPALALFVVGAAYEAFEIIYLVPPLLRG